MNTGAVIVCAIIICVIVYCLFSSIIPNIVRLFTRGEDKIGASLGLICSVMFVAILGWACQTAYTTQPQRL